MATGTSGLPREKLSAWGTQCEDLIGRDEYYRVERETVERQDEETARSH